MREQRLAVDGAEIAYDISGLVGRPVSGHVSDSGSVPGRSGPVVVQAHGLLSSRARDDVTGFDFSAVARTRRLVRYDARGHGASTGRAVVEDYTWPHLAGDLLALVETVTGGDDLPDDASSDATLSVPDTSVPDRSEPDRSVPVRSVEPVDAIGASMGCGALLHAALVRPGAFRRLVLVIPPTAWDVRVAQAAAYEGGAQVVERQGVGAFVEALTGQPVPPAMAGAPGPVVDPAVREDLLPAVLRGASRSDLPSRQALARLDHPTLILPWADDPTHPDSTAQALAAILPGAHLADPARSFADLAGWGEQAAAFLAQG